MDVALGSTTESPRMGTLSCSLEESFWLSPCMRGAMGDGESLTAVKHRSLLRCTRAHIPQSNGATFGGGKESNKGKKKEEKNIPVIYSCLPLCPHYGQHQVPFS